MPQFTCNEGICSNCKFASECRHASEGVQFCQEYQLADPSQPYKKPKAIPAAAVQSQIHQESNPGRSDGKVLGLCSNCLNRESCGYTRPESGVWHCEEYA